jgi:hypothetical protein
MLEDVTIKCDNNEDSISQINQMNNYPTPNLPEDILPKMKSLGFTKEQILLAHNIYNFSNLDDAIKIMTKDKNNNKYIHEYKDAYTICEICGDTYNHHNYTDNIINSSSDRIIEYLCSICFEAEMISDNKVTLSCNHEYCKKCISTYLKNKIITGNVKLII